MTWRGGWVLLLLCPCGAEQEFRAVVPGLLLDQAERAGWKFADEPVTGATRWEGLCVSCA